MRLKPYTYVPAVTTIVFVSFILCFICTYIYMLLWIGFSRGVIDHETPRNRITGSLKFFFYNFPCTRRIQNISSSYVHLLCEHHYSLRKPEMVVVRSHSVFFAISLLCVVALVLYTCYYIVTRRTHFAFGVPVFGTVQIQYLLYISTIIKSHRWPLYIAGVTQSENRFDLLTTRQSALVAKYVIRYSAWKKFVNSD